MKTIPRPSLRSRLTQNTGRFLQSPPAYMMDMQKTYGDIFEMGLLRPGIYALTHPEYAKQVLVTHNKNFIKDRPIRVMKMALGDSLLTTDGDFWRRQRRIAQPAFHREKLQGMAEAMIQHTAAMLEDWQGRTQPFDVAREMMRLTSRIVTETLFGANLENPDELGAAIHHSNAFMTHYFRNLVNWPLWVPTRHNREFHQNQALFNQTVHGLIDNRRQAPEGYADLLSMLMEARDEESGEGMTDKQLRDECITLFAAGHETSANALSWTFYLLSQHPEVVEQLRAEIQSIVGNRLPTVEDLRQLPYSIQVLNESMRLYPPAWIIGRENLEPEEVDGYVIPRGAEVVIPTWVIHRHPDFWEEPERFDPDRFRPEAVKERNKYAFFPFGGGPRLCIGNNFAMMEMQLILLMVIQRFRPTLVPGHPIAIEPLITLRPKHGVMVEMQAVQ